VISRLSSYMKNNTEIPVGITEKSSLMWQYKSTRTSDFQGHLSYDREFSSALNTSSSEKQKK